MKPKHCESWYWLHYRRSRMRREARRRKCPAGTLSFRIQLRSRF
jgi:hypothetical protein